MTTKVKKKPCAISTALPLACLSALLPLGCAPTAQVEEAQRPNVLLILVDDLGYHDLGSYGVEDFATPHIDRIAASGVRFTEGYVTSPQCGPSRASLMSGIHHLRFSYVHNSANAGLPTKEVALTLPEQMQEQGYTTGLIGKWHIGFVLDPDPQRYGFALPGNDPWERGFDYVLKHHAGGTDYFPYSEEGRQAMLAEYREPRLRLKAGVSHAPVYLDDLPADTYLTDYFSDQAVNFIHDKRDQPWFLFLSYTAPHTPMQAKADVLQQYAHIEDELRRTFIAMMHSLDDGIGKVLDALAASGQLDNTVIWFLSDNGGPTHRNASRNDPLSGRKGDVHEGGIRVPFMIAWPKVIAAGQVFSDPVISLDILPTSLAAAGASALPEIYDGKNLLPWLTGAATAPTHPELYWAWAHKSAVRVGDLKETRNGNNVLAVDGTRVAGHVFTNIRENPAELPGRGQIGREMEHMLAGRLNDWLRKAERDQWRLTPGMAVPDWQTDAVVFRTCFEDARQPGGLGAPIEPGGSVSSGYSVSPLSAGSGINAFRIDPTLPWDTFISEAAGSNIATTLQQAIDGDAYFEITVTADAPSHFTGVKFTLRGYGNERSGSIALRSSVDGFSSDLVRVTGSMVRKHPAVVDLRGNHAFTGLRSITLRFYLYDDFRGTDLVRIGIADLEVAATPTP